MGSMKIPIGAYPLMVVMVGSTAGLGYFLNHKLRHPDIIWARR